MNMRIPDYCNIYLSSQARGRPRAPSVLNRRARALAVLTRTLEPKAREGTTCYYSPHLHHEKYYEESKIKVGTLSTPSHASTAPVNTKQCSLMSQSPPLERDFFLLVVASVPGLSTSHFSYLPTLVHDALHATCKSGCMPLG